MLRRIHWDDFLDFRFESSKDKEFILQYTQSKEDVDSERAAWEEEPNDYS